MEVSRKFYFLSSALLFAGISSLFSQTLENKSYQNQIKSGEVKQSKITYNSDNSAFLKFENEIKWDISSDFFSGKVIPLRVNLSESPKTYSKIVSELKSGDVIVILERQFDTISGNRYKVAYYNQVGWVSERDLEFNKNYFEYERILNQAKSVEFLYLNSYQTESLKNSIKSYFDSRNQNELNIGIKLDSIKSLHKDRIESLKKKKDIQLQQRGNDLEFEQFKAKLEEEKLLFDNLAERDLEFQIDSLTQISHLEGNRIREENRRISDSLFLAETKKQQRLDSLSQANEEKERQKLRNEQIAQVEKRKSAIISRFGQEDGNKIMNRKIWIGMSEEMLIESWGKPQRINTTTTKYGKRKQYVYYERYVYIEDGKIESIQTSD